jgi:hypothetical protein
MKHNSPFFTEDFADWLENLPQERWAAISEPLMLITSFYVADRLNEDEQTAKANGRLDQRQKLTAGAKKFEH